MKVDSQDVGSEYTVDINRVSNDEVEDEDVTEEEAEGFAITNITSSITHKRLDEFCHGYNKDPSIGLWAPQPGDDLTKLGIGKTIFHTTFFDHRL